MGKRITCHNNQKRIKERFFLKRIEKFNCSGLEKSQGIFDKKRGGAELLILNSLSINTQLLTNIGENSKRFILFKKFYQSQKV